MLARDGNSIMFSVLLRGSIVNRTYGIHNKTIYLNIFPNNILVLLTMVPRNSTEIGPVLPWPKRERPLSPPPSPAHGSNSVGIMGWGGRSLAPPLLVRRGLGVLETSVEIPIRAILLVKAHVVSAKMGIFVY